MGLGQSRPKIYGHALHAPSIMGSVTLCAKFARLQGRRRSGRRWVGLYKGFLRSCSGAPAIMPHFFARSAPDAIYRLSINIREKARETATNPVAGDVALGVVRESWGGTKTRPVVAVVAVNCSASGFTGASVWRGQLIASARLSLLSLGVRHSRPA